MKIFGIGLHRTATSTVTEMVESLGWEISNYDHWPEMLEAARTTNFNMSFLKFCDGAFDLPTPIYFRQLDEAYPGSKFIFTDRALDSWLKSCENHCLNSVNMSKPDVVTHDLVFRSKEFVRENWVETYYWHRRNIRDYFTGDKSSSLLHIHLENNLAKNRAQVFQQLVAFLGHKIS